MKPLTFPFFEFPTEESPSLPAIEYSSSLHLQVLAGTSDPAIRHLSYDTETFTKAEVDTNDHEHDHHHVLVLAKYLDTQFQTRSSIDQTESDFPQ